MAFSEDTDFYDNGFFADDHGKKYILYYNLFHSFMCMCVYVYVYMKQKFHKIVHIFALCTTLWLFLLLFSLFNYFKEDWLQPNNLISWSTNGLPSHSFKTFSSLRYDAFLQHSLLSDCIPMNRFKIYKIFGNHLIRIPFHSLKILFWGTNLSN